MLEWIQGTSTLAGVQTKAVKRMPRAKPGKGSAGRTPVGAVG